MAKTRKSASKSGTAKGARGQKATRKAGPKKRAARKPKQLDLRPLKKQLRAHIALLSGGDPSNQRVQSALSRLQRLDEELAQDCDPTMILPLME